MARPKKISDEALLAACARVIGEYGPGFTVAHVAAEAGVSVGTVVGRFDSKHGLLVALMDVGTDSLEQRMNAVAAEHEDPVLALREALVVTASVIDDPETAVQHLAQLGTDLADPRLRAGIGVLRDRVRSVLVRLVRAAELPFAPPAARAAAVLAALVHGLAQDWALAPDGGLHDRLRDGADAVLTAWQGTANRGHPDEDPVTAKETAP